MQEIVRVVVENIKSPSPMQDNFLVPGLRHPEYIRGVKKRLADLHQFLTHRKDVTRREQIKFRCRNEELCVKNTWDAFYSPDEDILTVCDGYWTMADPFINPSKGRCALIGDLYITESRGTTKLPAISKFGTYQG